MKRHWTLGAVLALSAASVALPAAAQVDAQCAQRWQQAVTTRALGERCQYLDATTAAKLKALEDSNLACATAKASASDKAQLEQARQAAIKEMAGTPCNDTAKSAVSGQATTQMQR